MPPIPVYVVSPDDPGFGLKQVATDEIAIAGFDEFANATPVASLIYDGQHVFLRLGNLAGKTLPAEALLNGNGNIYVQTHNGDPVNYTP